MINISLLNPNIWKSKVHVNDVRIEGNYNRAAESEATYELKSEEKYM